MLDLDKIHNALIDLRWGAKQTQRGFAKLSGLNHGKIQRIESRKNKKSIPVDDLEKWLSACNVDLLEFLTKYYVSEVRAGPVAKPPLALSR